MPEFSNNRHHDTWMWVAYYDDGTHLAEFDEAGQDRGFAEVDLGRVTSFVLLSGQPWASDVVIDIDQSKGQRPIFFRRRRITIDGSTGERIGQYTIHYVGRQETVNGRNVKTFVRCYPNGSMRVTNHDNDDEIISVLEETQEER